MNEINWLEVFNSATTFGMLTIIAVGIWFLVLKKDKQGLPVNKRSRASKRRS